MSDGRGVQLPHDLEEDLASLEAWAADRFRTSGQDGPIDALVLLHLIRRARDLGTLAEIEVLGRECIEDLGGRVKSTTSVSRAWGRLVEAGVLVKHRTGGRWAGSLFTLVPPDPAEARILATPIGGDGEVIPGLSPRAHEVLYLLRAFPDRRLTASDLAEMVGIRYRTLIRTGGNWPGPLKVLEFAGLAERRSDGSWMAVDPTGAD